MNFYLNAKRKILESPALSFPIQEPRGEGLYKITHLDVTHLDVSNTTDFGYCFKKFGFGEKNKETTSSKIIGLEAWNVSSGKIFDFMFEQAFPFNESINLNLSSWRFSEKEEISFYYMFHCFGQQAK